MDFRHIFFIFTGQHVKYKQVAHRKIKKLKNIILIRKQFLSSEVIVENLEDSELCCYN